MSSTVHLDQGTTYRGRAIVFYPSIVVTRSKVKEELEKNGFSNVTVWMDEDELPSSWPASARKDVSSTGNTQAYLEGTWSKATGEYPSSGSKWGIYDYWIQSAPKKEAPPPSPSCRAIGDACQKNADCCSSFCSEGRCATPVQPVNLECAMEGMSCESLDCCDGLSCQEDVDAYWGGGFRCFKQSTDQAEPVKLNEPPKSKAGWYAAGIVLVAGLTWWLWPKKQQAIANPPKDR